MQKSKSFKFLNDKSKGNKNIKDILVNYINKKIINN